LPFLDEDMIELLTPAEMAEADRRTIAAGTPGEKLMDRAGRAVADIVAARHPLGTRVAVACGPGNNGGDGFVAARVLRERGYPVRVFLLGAREALRGDAYNAAARWGDMIEAISASSFSNSAVVIDALFGAGLSRDLDGKSKTVVELIAASGASVVAVDLPSGIDGTTGAVRGAAVRATETVTFCRRKLGHLLMPGRLYCGRVHLAEIGIADSTVAALNVRTFVDEPGLWRRVFPIPKIDGHKYDRGHAVVVSGPMHATGAARLAARAALRAGAGLVTIAAPRTAVPIVASAVTTVMVREANGARGLSGLLADKRLNVVLLGPGQGVGKATRDSVAAAAKAKRLLVLDADALSSFAESKESLARLLSGVPAAIVTPHEGEFARLFGGDRDVARASSKIERARAAARNLKAVMVLKGPDTVIAAPDGRAAVADNGPPWLATAGTGDVLAGLATGLLAQGMPAFEAACAAVWLHGEAGQEAGPGLIAEELSETLPSVYRRLFEGK
jgi:ADP-dependent NAD(P)H-hydrate dehydratase / NAD(P)H-hydrate epimerase